MASKIDIINRALVKVGQARISSIDENSKGATSIRTVYDQVRDTLMQSYVWNFAKVRVQLAADAAAPDSLSARASGKAAERHRSAAPVP